MSFYTYLYVINGVAEYAGKGKDGRWYDHLASKKNTEWVNHLRKSKEVGRHIELKLLPVESEELAFLVEQELIAKYGRRDLGTGTLYNLTDGGDGISGHRRSEATRTAIGNFHRGRTFTDEHRANIAKGAKALPPELRGRRKCRPCTIDGTTIYPSVVALIKALGQGKSGAKHPDFRLCSDVISEVVL